MNKADFPIPSERCKEGANLCLDNAIRLFKEAKLLFENEIYLTSSFLAIFSLEEIGKGVALLEAFKNKKAVTRTKWQKLTKGKAHLIKIRAGRKIAQKQLEKEFYNMVGFRFKSISNKDKEEAHKILAKHFQWWKEKSLYVDWEQSNWTSPMKFDKKNRMVFAGWEIIESFEGCKALAEDLGRNTSDLEKTFDEFTETFHQRIVLYWNLKERPLKR